MFPLELHEASSGLSPVRDFIRSLSAKGKAEFLQIPGLLKEKGPDVRMAYLKSG